jgi:hypothetical protein
MPHTRSSGASPSRLTAHRSRVWVEFRATEQEERHRRVLRRLSSGQQATWLNLPFRGWFLPLKQRVSEWQAISGTQGEIPCDAS